MIRLRSLLLGFAGLLVMGGGVAWFSPVAPAQEAKKGGDEKPAAEESKPTEETAAKTHTVKAGTFRIETELDGILEASQMMPLSLRPEVFKTLEVVKAVDHGTEVKAGQQLVWLDTQDLDDQIRDTQQSVELGELSLKSAREDLEYLKAISPLNLAQAERTNMIAQRELKQYLETDRPLSVRTAKHSLKNSEGQLENVMEELQQLEKMYKADDLTEETEEIILKRARRSVESAELSLELAKVRADRSLNETIPEEEVRLTESAKRAALSLAKLKISQPVERKQQEIALEKLVHTQAKLVEKLEKLKQDREMLNVTAPTAGVVYYGDCQDGKWTGIDTVAKQLEPAKTLTANQVFMTIVQLRPLQVRLSVSEKELRDVQTGVKGEAVPTAYPDQKLPVSVTSVSRIPGGSTKFDTLASIQLDNADALVPGMTCKVKLVSYEKKNTIAIPEKAVFLEEDQPDKTYVYLVGEEGKPMKRPVTIGKKHAGKVEITKGLKTGDKILTEKPKD
jgi:RND family efflux transporter MFP subunit